MKFQVNANINAPKEKVWQAITDWEGAPDRISGIKQIEILEQPDSGLVGFKWKETRTMFGKEATEVMWITDAVDNEYYDVRAESHGSIYLSKMAITGDETTSDLTWTFDATPVTMGAKIMSFLMGFMFKGATQKVLQKDLDDIKASIEEQP